MNTKPVINGPKSYGFDYSFCVPASLDMPPYVYVENGSCQGLPADTCLAGKGMGFYRKGVTSPGFRHDKILQTLTSKALDYISLHATDQQPFFLYFPLTAPHTPILPSAEYAGKSGLNAYADFVLMVDNVIKQVVERLKKEGVYNNTLIVFTSDNGCSPQADFKTLAEKGHNPSWKYRGMKADIFDGGHRVPMVVSWPTEIRQKFISDQLICSTDFFRTIANLLGQPLPDNMAEDSFSFLKELNHKNPNLPVRESIVNHSIAGNFAISKGKWKLIFCSHSGGWSVPKPDSEKAKVLPPLQLYDTFADIGENNNLVKEYPGIVKELTTIISNFVRKGRSTPGTKQPNTGPERWEQLTWMQ
jgi:arylsulfatase A